MYEIKITKVIEVLEQISNENNAFLDKEKYEIVWVFGDLIFDINDMEFDDNYQRYTKWEKDNLMLLQKVMYEEKYIAFPTQRDIFEYKIIENFCYQLPDFLRSIFLNEIYKKNAFSNFKNLIRIHNLVEKWYDFKKEKLYQKAIEWCIENDIKYFDDNLQKLK